MAHALGMHTDQLSDAGFPHSVNQAFFGQIDSVCALPVLALFFVFAVSTSQQSSGHRQLSAERLFGPAVVSFQHRLYHQLQGPEQPHDNLQGQ